jgi:hypothetical protein
MLLSLERRTETGTEIWGCFAGIWLFSFYTPRYVVAKTLHNKNLLNEDTEVYSCAKNYFKSRFQYDPEILPQYLQVT